MFLIAPVFACFAERPPAVVVDTMQDRCYDVLEPIEMPRMGQKYFGQDAQYAGVAAVYRDNADGTVSDLNTGLMWSKAVDVRKATLEEAEAQARDMRLAGFDDWRVPTIKELYSLVDFRGRTGTSRPGQFTTVPDNAIPYINTDYFDFRYGAVDAGERFIDAQWLSCTKYVSTTMRGQATLFGVNFADGRIKGYGLQDPRRGQEKKFYVRYVRGRVGYGDNNFQDNGDGTVTDLATGLTWMQADSGVGMNWVEALQYAENLKLADHEDWRLPNAKELQSIVDYARSPNTTDSAAIAPVFATSKIKNEAGEADYPYFWTSTTHVDGPNARQAVYLSFGRAIGQMHGQVMDVHGAGAQRSDLKEGQPRIGHGPQGDAQRVANFVRCVRGGAVLMEAGRTRVERTDAYPNTICVNGKRYQPEAMEYRDLPAGGGSGLSEGPGGGLPFPPPFGRPPPR
ncbi:DUF1566 domain-containing protein [Coraliomargarita parva]|uniref:Lcl C-terminal domain-containing protein n=1 Tax=Coraliomargarita parva TaxID=3014050 RepID=UPI0022B47AC9|nr:DUF1566 domain-containing protein [Coraliomargarita parva]